jgi:hypothetical protein
MKNFKRLLVVLVLLGNLSGFASTGQGSTGEEVVNTLEVTINGKIATVNKRYGVKMYIFETVTGEHVNTKTSNTIDFTLLQSGLYTILVKGYAPVTFEIK